MTTRREVITLIGGAAAWPFAQEGHAGDRILGQRLRLSSSVEGQTFSVQ
jgi:hypothetical protein